IVHLFHYLFEDPQRAKENAKYVQMVVNNQYRMEKIVDITLGLYTAALFRRFGMLMNHYLANHDKGSAKKLYDIIAKNLPFDPARTM
ncbi:MAG: hypothetical protein DRP09_19565, partial [Candidatus Thorarchaeota archaeon]